MIPTSSSISSNGCDNISSNCVIWQGPDIACIDLCSGDTITEITFKLATKVCDLITNGVVANPSLTGLDLSCLNIPGLTPTELVPVLQEMVTAICADDGRSGKSTYTLPIMTLPACMQYNDVNGNPVTELRLDLFASLIANQVCTNLSSINIINTTLTSLDSRIDILEACVLPCSGAVAEVQVIPTCVLPAALTNVSVLLLALEVRFCALETAVGLPAAILGTISQSFITSSTSTLTTPGSNYGSIGGWNSSPINLAQTVQNAWVVIDDMYTAIAAIQLNCCPGGCDSVIYAYSTTNNLNPNGTISGVTFNFINSSIPSGFNDCSGSTVVTLTDTSGVAVTTVVSVSTLQNNGSGVLIPVPSLDTTSALTATVAFCTSDGINTCTETQTSSIAGALPCPIVAISAITKDGCTVNFSNTLGVTATYKIDAVNVSTGAIDETYTWNNPGGPLSYIFVGLVAGTAYNIILNVTLNGVTKACPANAVTTETASPPCDAGMDVAFVIDYTSSMTSIINNIKSGVATLVNTIQTSSGANDYRISLTTADENTSGVPNYSACTDYTSLPAPQKVVNVGPSGRRQIITAWEKFQTNNGTSFSSQLAKLNGGAAGSCIQMGQGIDGPEPCDYAAQLITGAGALTGTFRPAVAKYVIILTDNLPGGQSDAFNSTVWAGIQQMILDANNSGIKYFVCGPGASLNGSGSLSSIYPWKELATQTGGTWNVSADASQISADIVAGCA
tara:strand:- start:49 stop:2247 length:2199 start_codon:yes stop_codon:yes gene_type:complete